MIRMSKLTDYAILVLAYLAEAREPLHSAAEVAEHTGVTPATASKLLKQLTRAGLVDSVRGAQGGYSLARAAEEITAAQVIDGLEGPVAITECSSAERFTASCISSQTAASQVPVEEGSEKVRAGRVSSQVFASQLPSSPSDAAKAWRASDSYRTPRISYRKYMKT